MANSIDITVRTEDQASRGFDRIGDAAVKMNASIDLAGSALESLDAIQQSGANKAAQRAQLQNDVKQAMIDSEQAQNDLKQATIDANQAQLDATQAQTDYNDAVKEHGKNSQEAKQAQADLTQATYDSQQAQTDMKQAQVDATQAQLDLNAAQRELNPTLVQQMSDKFQQFAPAVALASMAMTNLGATTALTRARTVALTVATKAQAIAQRVLNVVMRANPLGLVITAITLLVGALVLAYKRSETFRNAVNSSFRAVSAGARIMVSYIRSRLNSLVSFFSGIPGRARRAFSSLYGAITNPVRNAVNAVRSWLSGLLSFASSIPSKIGGAIKNSIPGFAHGGVVGAAGGGPRSGLTMVGEHGPELVKLPSGSRVFGNAQSRGMASGGNGGSQVVKIIVEGTGLLAGLRKEIRVQGGNVQTVLGK